jgi:CheY-like chemotaxis protein
VLSAQDGALQLIADGDSLCFRVMLPSADETTVLVVDDNQDLVHFYRRYTAGSRYRIVDVPFGKDALAAVEAHAPGIIVLDVMLPDVDGWELLGRLHENPVTRAVPIIVCSVIREAELALELGAMLYLPKPVRRGELLAALDQAAAAHAALMPD